MSHYPEIPGPNRAQSRIPEPVHGPGYDSQRPANNPLEILRILRNVNLPNEPNEKELLTTTLSIGYSQNAGAAK
ncbi:MAG: hypothetical protein NTY38_00150, partial [Acidobacteria bacterium]|nr:hypothetical protein [Acidobacteriota bacterium]